MRVLPTLCFVAIVAACLATSDPAHAQKIRTYGDSQSSGQDSGGQSGGSQAGSQGGAAWYPGMPAPDQGGGQQGGQQAKGDQQGQQKQGEGEGEETIGPSHKISVYGGGGGDPRDSSAPRTTLDMAIDKMYRGIIPGKRDQVDHLREKDEQDSATLGPNRLTWIGFQPEDDKTRIFVQTSRRADYNMERKPAKKTLVLRIEDTKITARNFSRFIDTSYFDRNIQKITTKKAEDGAVEIHIEVSEMESPMIQQDGGYLYADFPYESKEKSKTKSGESQSSDESQK